MSNNRPWQQYVNTLPMRHERVCKQLLLTCTMQNPPMHTRIQAAAQQARVFPLYVIQGHNSLLHSFTPHPAKDSQPGLLGR